METDSKEILDTFDSMIRDSTILDLESFENKYSSFKEKFEKLHQMTIDSIKRDNVQETRKILCMMLDSRNNLKNGKVNELNTDLLVGNYLGKKYIYPKVGNPSQNDYNKAVKKINEKIKKSESVVDEF